MPPRVAYWTSSFEPGMEAIASEVATLRRQFPGSVVWGLSHKHWVLLSRTRGYCVHPRLHLLFRAITRLAERTFDLNHVFGSLGDWFYLEGLRRRPTILTIVVAHSPLGADVLNRVDRFVVEYPEARDDLIALGIEAERIRLIFPPVDLRHFSPATVADGPFRVLFASSPEADTWLDARGVPQILDAAALRPDMRFRLLWRPWGNAAERVRQWIAERGLKNVELVVKYVADMASEYNHAHVTLAPFTDAQRCKGAPNSLIESLACGRPVLTTGVVGLGELIEKEGAGLLCVPTGEQLAEYLDRLAASWDIYSLGARKLAEHWFGVERFLGEYHRLYEEVLAAVSGL
jgi:glycosyltransferase involved in cell wall biosynthesis